MLKVELVVIAVKLNKIGGPLGTLVFIAPALLECHFRLL